ncbi:MAG: hypothetical protein IT201_06125 [Thermoleophilia bacterium]|nr:hypothetical protein [Thermoleophilia bacterium]
MGARDLLDEARRELDAGNGKNAARLLTEAAYATRDAALEAEIRSLAQRGRDGAGRFGKGRWDEIVRIADLRTASSAKTEAA